MFTSCATKKKSKLFDTTSLATTVPEDGLTTSPLALEPKNLSSILFLTIISANSGLYSGSIFANIALISFVSTSITIGICESPTPSRYMIISSGSALFTSRYFIIASRTRFAKLGINSSPALGCILILAKMRVKASSRVAQNPMQLFFSFPILWNTSTPIIIAFRFPQAAGFAVTQIGSPTFAFICKRIFEQTASVFFCKEVVTITCEGTPSSLLQTCLITG
mmetsp:Transcript_32438/g.37494  ORF Transcript_32438/g.37494 Transcript_32438/m.37494 type:complete len:222 (-) Transcript_32438:1464-2129(-)